MPLPAMRTYEDAVNLVAAQLEDARRRGVTLLEKLEEFPLTPESRAALALYVTVELQTLEETLYQLQTQGGARAIHPTA